MRVASGLVLLALLLPSPAWALWPHDPIAGNLPVCTVVGTQAGQRLASDGAGGAFVVWGDLRTTTSHVYVQHLGATGVTLWSTNGVPVSAVSAAQTYPTLAADGAGGVVVVWTDARSGAGTDLYAQRFNASGVAQWTAGGVPLCTAGGDQTYPELIADGSGGALVTWPDGRTGTLDIYAQRIGGAGTVQWTANGVPVCAAADAQAIPKLATDAAGGAILTWYDYRSGSPCVFAQRVSAAGVSQWTTDGVAIASVTPGPKVYPDIVPDGIGGAVIAWQDWRSGAANDVYAQRVNSGGGTYWVTDGVALCTAADNQQLVILAPDGTGGAIVGWSDWRSGVTDVYAQRLDGSGHEAWTPGGVPLSQAVGSQAYPVIATDGQGGAVVVWQDDRAGNTDLYAQRIERYGYLGPEPAIASVRDVRGDQGGQVKVSWNASWVDAYPAWAILDYRLWRSVPAAAQAARALPSRRIVTDPDRAAADGLLLASPDGATDYAWEIVTTQAADGLAAYSLVASTTSDSTASSNPRTAFMVEARTSASPTTAHWFSPADSGYSADNLEPAAPAPFTGAYAAGTAMLQWNRNTEADLAGYRLYRGAQAAFVPGPGSLVAQLTESAYSDVAGSPWIYKLTALDVHGNESPATTLVPGGTAGVGEAPPAVLAFAAPSPNPASRATALRFTLPVAGAVQLAIHDPSGRIVRRLAAGERAAGVFTLAWDLRDDGGRPVPAGLYFVRLAAGGTTLVRRLVVAH